MLGDKRLDQIDNRRLVNLKEKTMPWNFSITWVPGKTIPAPDATSRRPQESAVPKDSFSAAISAIMTTEESGEDLAGDAEFAAMGRLKANEIAAVTWERVKEETWLDDNMRHLIEAIHNGFNEAVQE